MDAKRKKSPLGHLLISFFLCFVDSLRCLKANLPIVDDNIKGDYFNNYYDLPENKLRNSFLLLTYS